MNMAPVNISSCKLSELLQGITSVDDQHDCLISGLSLDSRKAEAGDLFFACAGQQGHGMDYIEQALDAGVSAVAWEPVSDSAQTPPEPLSLDRHVPVYAVKDLGNQIGFIADRFYGHPSKNLLVIGITGTDGKTSCSQFLANTLDSEEHRCGVIGTLGYGLYGELQPASHTTPDAIRLHALLADMLAQGASHVVMEVSSHGLDQGRVNGVCFDVAVLTNLTRDHLDYHGDEAAYALAKQRLFEVPGLKTAVLNRDDAFGREILAGLPGHVQAIAYGFSGTENIQSHSPGQLQKQSHIIASGLVLGDNGFNFFVQTPWGGSQINSPLLGGFNASNLLAVLSVLLVLGVEFEEACNRIESLDTVAGRMERFGGGAKPLVVVDYAHTPDALKHVLESLRPHCKGNLVCVFGCGGDRDRGKRSIMGGVAEQYADTVVLTDDNPRNEDPEQIINEIIAGIQNADSVHVERDRARAINDVVRRAKSDDIILVAGKGHEEYQLVKGERIPFSDRKLVSQLLREVAE